MRNTRIHLWFGLAAALLAAVSSSSASARPAESATATGVGFISLPAKAFEGQRTTFKVRVAPASKSCRLVIHYQSGRVQRLAARPAPKGRAAWTVRIPAVPPGVATLTATCAGSGIATGLVSIQVALEAPKLAVTKRGYSQRPHKYDPGSDVNYGLSIRNERLRSDATSVDVLVNAVDATNRVLGSAHLSLSRVPAAATIYLGGQISIPTQTPATRLEVVFVDATSAQRQPALPPLVSDLVLTPASDGYLQSIRGQLLNRYARPLQYGNLGVVFEDGTGAIVGGGTGSASGPLSLGAREAFEVDGPFSAIPAAKIVTTLVSVVPTYPTT